MPRGKDNGPGRPKMDAESKRKAKERLAPYNFTKGNKYSKGRPRLPEFMKGARGKELRDMHLTGVLREMLASIKYETSEGDKIEAVYQINKAVMDKAASGDMEAIKFLYERIDGKVKQVTEEIGTQNINHKYDVSPALMERLGLTPQEKGRMERVKHRAEHIDANGDIQLIELTPDDG